jgi:hypothetical protein
MPYILYKTNGTTLTTVGDASLDTTTDIQFVGRNYSGYGQVVNENFVKLLENFAGTSAPTKPVIGELWYDTSSGRLNVNYGGTSNTFKSLANMYVGSESNPPSTVLTNEGDFWWDTTTGQLKAKHGSSYILIGPPLAASSKSSIVPTEEYSLQNQDVTTPFIEAFIGTTPIATISNSNFTPVSGSTLLGSNFTVVSKGITLAGTDINGSSQYYGYYFWGTSTDSLKSNTSTTATIAMSVAVGNDDSSNTDYYMSFVGGTSGNQRVITSNNLKYNPSTQILNATATSARYADLAERYEADAVYEEGTVLVIGGNKEVTACQEWGATYWAGIVSKNPAYMMNSEAGTDETHPYIALKGRVPCKVVGPVSKGDMLVCSAYPGHAQTISVDNFNPAAIIARALEDFDGDFGVIEVKV